MDTGTVAAFLAVDLLLVCTPGADWAYAIRAGLRDRSVVPAVTGLIAGYAGHTLLAVAGLVLLVARSASLLTALTVLGAVYLMWLGCAVLARPAGPHASMEALASSPWQIMLKGAGVSGLNPKALLLYFSLLPQFISPGAGWPVAAQTGLFGVLHMASCTVVYLAVGVLARTVLQARPAAARAVTRATGVMMIVIGGILLVERLAG
ncbi:LysE family translocator [Actinoallomurus purpureus]|uniref:LysE family translocator n=1 Tax=Actinoallomurus purpureus TaxID=478114 RepID=UPI00209258C4|nr:LysE family translocator [Actinoallomurus purpureus]MCO6011637.1 LysE family translocator [Actinoallomurus purpureus]